MLAERQTKFNTIAAMNIRPSSAVALENEPVILFATVPIVNRAAGAAAALAPSLDFLQGTFEKIYFQSFFR